MVPPDLWIHHDQMELKTLDKSSNSESNMTITPIQRNSQELCHEPLLNTLEKKKSAYLGIIHFQLLLSCSIIFYIYIYTRVLSCLIEIITKFDCMKIFPVEGQSFD